MIGSSSEIKINAAVTRDKVLLFQLKNGSVPPIVYWKYINDEIIDLDKQKC